MTRPGEGSVRWLVGARASDLRGHEQVRWQDLRDRWVQVVRHAARPRTALQSPAQEWFDWLARIDRLAVLGVVLDGPDALADLLGFVVEPAVRLGIDLVVVADRVLDDLEVAEFEDPSFGYAYTLQRLRWLTATPTLQLTDPVALPAAEVALDDSQRRAVKAGHGVVQIIAPAGSGKTAVLIERVRELRRRGVPAKAILCLTFNKDAAAEIRGRLKQDARDVTALTFNSVGRFILKEEKRLRKHTRPSLPPGQWRDIADEAKKRAGPDGTRLLPAEAEACVSDLKLGRLVSPQECRASIGVASSARERTVAALYEVYEEHQRKKNQMDFDDQILWSVQLLRSEPELRETWQHRWEWLLVDEYQDIEPAQELLVRLLAAPHDQLFCIGDEDQTLYGFRRASVERIIRLDELYPGLQRIALGTNYRCPGDVVAASDRLIAINQVRLPKRIAAATDRRHERAIVPLPVVSERETATDIARRLKVRERGEIVVLARTIYALRPVALACADLGVKIDGPDALFDAVKARTALRQHLQVVVETGKVDDKLVQAVCRVPRRDLNASASAIAARLREGMSFEDAFAGAVGFLRADGVQLAAGELFSRVGACEDARDAVAVLRTDGGLDHWFSEGDQADRFECESLELAEADAGGVPLKEYLQHLREQAARLTRSKDVGMELATIHGSKGRQWPHVIVVACDDETLPLARSLRVSEREVERGEGMEAERRLAYVAFTRAQQRLELHYDKTNPSPFLAEAELLDNEPSQTHATEPTPVTDERPDANGARPAVHDAVADAAHAEQVVGEQVVAEQVVAEQVSVVTADRPAPTAPVATLETGMSAPSGAPDNGGVREMRAATAAFVAAGRMSRRMTIGRVASDLGLGRDELEGLMSVVDGASARTKLRKLDVKQAAALSQAIRDLR